MLRLGTAITRLESSERSDETSYCLQEPLRRSFPELELESPENQYTVPNLRHRATDGCRLCSLVLRAFTKEGS